MATPQAGGSGAVNNIVQNNVDNDPPLQVEERPQFRLNTFSGKEDPAEVRAFLRKVTTLQGQTGWTATKMANMVAFHLKDKAARWYDNLRIDDPVTCDNWDLLRPQFEARFLPVLTSADLALLNEESKMTTDMDVMEFYDYCRHIQHRIALTVSEPHRTGIHKVAFDEYFNSQLLNRFLQGLRPELREKVLSQDVKTIPQALEKAKAVEIALRKEKPKLKMIAELSEDNELSPEQVQEMEELTQRIEEIRTGGGRGRNPFRRTNNRTPGNNNNNNGGYGNQSNQGRRWNQGRNSGRNNSWGPTNRTPDSQDRGQRPNNQDARNKTCFLCKQPGHFVANCNQWKKLQSQTASSPAPKSNLAAIEHQKSTDEVSSLEPANPWRGLPPWNQMVDKSTYPF